MDAPLGTGWENGEPLKAKQDEAESVCPFSLGGKLQSPNTLSGTHEMLF